MQTDEHKKHINAVIDAIRAESGGKFNMNHWCFYNYWIGPHERINVCGTTMCIGGYSDWIALGSPTMIELANVETDVMTVAKRFGIRAYEANDLCYPESLPTGRCYNDITVDEAIAALEYVRDEGRFDGWDMFVDDDE